MQAQLILNHKDAIEQCEQAGFPLGSQHTIESP
jgi:hypothetical protein